MNLFSWITSNVKNAVLRGFAEAADELGLQQDANPDSPLALLQARIAPPAALTEANGEAKPPRRAK